MKQDALKNMGFEKFIFSDLSYKLDPIVSSSDKPIPVWAGLLIAE